MKVLVCGDRNWYDRAYIYRCLDYLYPFITLVIEGEANGADKISRGWAADRGVPFDPHPADWSAYGKAAGPVRNGEMLAVGPNLVIGFHNDITRSKGTRDMLTIARRKGIDTFLLPRDEEALLTYAQQLRVAALGLT